jgi:hypothetical protein
VCLQTKERKKRMASHAREGHKAQRKTREEAAPANVPPLSPLDFAQSVFRDPAQPMALRAGMAKAALPYMHGRRAPANADADREQAPKLPPPFDQPDPYGALRVEWRDALEQAGLISPMHLSSREAGRSESEAGEVSAPALARAHHSASKTRVNALMVRRPSPSVTNPNMVRAEPGA